MVRTNGLFGPLLVAILPLGCAGGPGGGSEAPRATPAPAAIPQGVDAVWVGAIAIVGNAPVEQVVLRVERDAPGIELRGALRPELRSLTGARVRVWGRVVPGRALVVTDYTVLEIAGGSPAVGTVKTYDWGVAIEAGHGRVHVYDAPAELRRQAGAKVWVNLNARGGVASYGVIGKR